MGRKTSDICVPCWVLCCEVCNKPDTTLFGVLTFPKERGKVGLGGLRNPPPPSRKHDDCPGAVKNADLALLLTLSSSPPSPPPPPQTYPLSAGYAGGSRACYTQQKIQYEQVQPVCCRLHSSTGSKVNVSAALVSFPQKSLDHRAPCTKHADATIETVGPLRDSGA